MEYELWRLDIFGQTESSDPASLDLSDETYSCADLEAFDHIDRALVDPDIHDLFSKQQIGIGLNLIYSNCCSDLPYCYTKAGDERRRLTGIANLKHLYGNYFARYCSSTVNNIGNDLDGNMGYICYMLWDVFVLYPGNAAHKMINAALEVMDTALHLKNESCIVSAIHGLGHWVDGAPEAVPILRSWLRKPTTKNQQIIEYANQASSGCIL